METYRRNSVNKKQMGFDSDTFKYFLPYWILTILLVFALFAIAAVIYIITPLTQNSLPVMSRTIFIVSELFVAYLAGKFTKAPALQTGVIYGLGFSVLTLLVGICTGSAKIFSLEVLLLLITGVLLGMLGSVAGMSLPKKKRKNIKFTR